MMSSVSEIHTESGGPFVQIAMEVQDRINVQIRKLLVLTFPGIAQCASDKRVCPMFVSDTKRSWRGGLDYALAESMKSRDSHTVASLICDLYTHLFEAVLHFLSRFIREGYS